MILFALRESVNETTGVAPYTLVYGRLPVEPLAVLKNMCINENDFPALKNKSTAEFLKDLRDKLEIAVPAITRLALESKINGLQHLYA